MKTAVRSLLFFGCIFSLLFMTAYHPSQVFAAKADKKAVAADPETMDNSVKVNAAFDAKKMGDMSDFDPLNPIIPEGDTIKIAVVASFSGPSAHTGNVFWLCVQWAIHDINKRGGLMVDGKKKFVQAIKADHMGKADQCKKICERMVLQEKVHVLWGTDGSHMMKIINETANKYKIISLNAVSLSEDLMNAANFGRYSFQTAFSTEQVGRAFAYYYGQIRKKEKKFYIVCQDYSFGHSMADGFKKGLKEFYPEAQLVGEDYHKLFLTDYAPYLTKIKASGAEVIFTGDWVPDCTNLLKQARQMGIMVPFANIYMDEPNGLHDVGVEGTKGLANLTCYFQGSNPYFKSPDMIKVYKAWHKQWETKWTPPYNSRSFEPFIGNNAAWAMHTYWLLSVIERAKSTDPEKIVAVWENDTYRMMNGKVLKMRACDHKVIQDLTVSEFVPPEQQKVSMNIPPYYWYKGTSSYGPAFNIPAAKVLPWMDQKLDRCKGKNNWGL